MNPVSGIVLYLVIWFMTLFVVLPIRLKTQEEDGDIVPGTPPSAPAYPGLKKRFFWTTIIATLVFIPVAGIIIFDIITVEDIDFFKRM